MLLKSYARSVFCLILFLMLLYFTCGGERYQICSQFSFGGGNYRQTTLNVIVNWNARVEEVVEEIMSEYVRVNADNCADEVILRMYRSRNALKKGNYFQEYVLAI